MLLKAYESPVALLGGMSPFCSPGEEKSKGYEMRRKGIVFRGGLIQEIVEVGDGESGYQSALALLRQKYGDVLNVIKLDENCFVFPGMIDIHNHIDYNLMPIWEHPSELTRAGVDWDNRHEWRHKNCREYQTDISGFHDFIISYMMEKGGMSKEAVMLKLQFFSELQAIAGGTTTLQESEGLRDGDVYYPTQHLLLRSTGVPEDLGLAKEQAVSNVIDFFKPDIAFKTEPDDLYYPPLDTGSWTTVARDNYEKYIDLLKNNSADTIRRKTGGYQVHLAEGRAGDLKAQGMDLYSKKEFETLRDAILGIPGYKEKVKASRLAIIHGCGIDLTKQENIDFINDCDIHIVWSPVSNLLLYGDTPNFIKSGIRPELLCLGSDWAPSGSKHVWDEAAFAQLFEKKHFYNGTLPQDGFDRIFDMITKNPAASLNSELLGGIAVGKAADFYIVSSTRNVPAQAAAPVTFLKNIFVFNDYHSVGTVVNGNLVFGTAELFKAFGTEGVSIASDGMNALNLMAYVPASLGIRFDDDLKLIDDAFAAYSERQGKTYARSCFLSSNDMAYYNRIRQLEKEFC